MRFSAKMISLVRSNIHRKSDLSCHLTTQEEKALLCRVVVDLKDKDYDTFSSAVPQSLVNSTEIIAKLLSQEASPDRDYRLVREFLMQAFLLVHIESKLSD